MIHSYKILHRKITHLQTGLQKINCNEEQGSPRTEELGWHRAPRETEGDEQQHCRTVPLTVTRLAEHWMIFGSQIRGVTKPECSRTAMASKQGNAAQQ